MTVTGLLRLSRQPLVARSSMLVARSSRTSWMSCGGRELRNVRQTGLSGTLTEISCLSRRYTQMTRKRNLRVGHSSSRRPLKLARCLAIAHRARADFAGDGHERCFTPATQMGRGQGSNGDVAGSFMIQVLH